ncbi:MoxR family ATPase [candidate division KSB1 bacterium]|nr:MoxR family ATPase [candidate division KSB1 bacterium]
MITEADVQHACDKTKLLIESIEKIIKGKREEIVKVVTCMVAGGHILVEDLPGLGKTSMAKALAFSIYGEDHRVNPTSAANRTVQFKRIQFTPDLLPMDLIGTYIFDDRKKEFIFKQGPLFANIILADEINRASPKVQSALLECMAENQITVGEKTFSLEDLFFVIATQNPIEIEGTYPLPAAQLDRFYMKISFGYVTEEKEFEIYENYRTINRITETVSPVLTYEDILSLQSTAEKIELHPEIIQSVRNIVFATRKDPKIRLGASTRSGIIFLKCVRAYALLQGRTFTTEDDIKTLAKSVLNHRLIFVHHDARESAFNQIIDQEIDRLSNLNLSRREI